MQMKSIPSARKTRLGVGLAAWWIAAVTGVADQLANGQAASLVIGQPDFESSTCNQGVAVNAHTLCFPVGAVVDSADNLYVSDASNHRLLEFATPFTSCAGTFPCVVSEAPSKVIGQPNFTSGSCNNGGVSSTSLCNPQRLAFDKVGNLYVDDFSNNRVLEYDGAGTTATKEFGQGTAGSDFTDNSCNNGGVTANSLCQPNGVGVDGSNNVYISDSSNNRILEYNETTASNTPKSPNNFTANEAFGQGGVFTSNSCNGGGVNSTTLCNPVGLSFDSTGDLLAADFSNSRMLLYSTPASNTTATTVFGQGASFSSSICNVNGNAPSPETLCNPDDPIGDATGNIVLSDQANNRTLFYPGPFSATPLIAAPDTAAASSAISSSRITVSARQLKFAATRVNRESKPAKFTVTNAGNAPVQILTVEATGRDFELLNQCAGPLPAGGSCTVTVKLKPITTGQRGGEIVITDNTLQGPQAVRVSGRATR